MKTTIFSLISMTLAFGLQNAEAAKLENTDKLKSESLQSVHSAWSDMCSYFSDWENVGQITCTYNTIKVLSRSRSEKWSNTIKQSIFMNGDGYVSEASASTIKNSATKLNKKIDSLLEDAGYKQSNSALNQRIGFLKKTLKSDASERPYILAFNASYQHAFANGAGIYLIDLETSEMLEMFLNAEE